VVVKQPLVVPCTGSEMGAAQPPAGKRYFLNGALVSAATAGANGTVGAKDTTSLVEKKPPEKAGGS